MPSIPSILREDGAASESPHGCAELAHVRNTARSIASTVLGGAIFAWIGLVVKPHADWLGQPLMVGGIGAWAFGCLWLAVFCKGKRECLIGLLWLHATGLPAFAGALLLLGPIGGPYHAWFLEWSQANLPSWTLAAFDDGYTFAVEALFGGLFCWQCVRLQAICIRARAADRPAPRKRWVIPPPPTAASARGGSIR